MHDWTLLSIHYEWKEARATFIFKGRGTLNVLVAQGLKDLHVPQIRAWGPSVSVNCVDGPTETENDLKKLAIEMQSGDTITLLAASYSLELA